LRGRITLSASPALILSAAGTSISYAAGAEGAGGITLGHKLVGKQRDGSYLTITSQFVTPVEHIITEDGRPSGLTLSPDGTTAAALNTGGASSYVS
jgi:hypothetical protein